MTDIHAWWQRGDELAITACGLKLGTNDPLRAATVWGNSGVEITCDECKKTLRAVGVGVAATQSVGGI